MRLPILILILLLGVIRLNSQVEIGENVSKAVIIETVDGSVVYGFVVDRTDDAVVVRSNSLGTVTVPSIEISKIKYIDNITNIIFDKNGFPVSFHNSTHHFFFPTGYGLKKGQSYYQNVWVFGNTVSYGVSDNFMITGGMEIGSILFAGAVPGFLVSTKFSVPFNNQKGAFGINATVLGPPGDSFDATGFLTSSITFGSRNNNFTIGAGAGFNFDGGITDEVIPVILAGMTRLSSKISFVTENYFIFQNDFDQADAMMSAGIRIHFKQLGNAMNIGLVRPLSIDTGPFIAFPLVSATVALNNK